MNLEFQYTNKFDIQTYMYFIGTNSVFVLSHDCI